MPTFEVTHGEHSDLIVADHALDARAAFNDKRKVWPSPKAVKCAEVTPAELAARAKAAQAKSEADAKASTEADEANAKAAEPPKTETRQEPKLKSK